MPPRPDFDRAPFIVIWEATRACDLACSHCRAEAVPERHPDELDDAEARALLSHVREEFGPVLFVITGGDPLKRPGLEDLIAHGRDLGLRMTITPSATPLLTTQRIDSLQAAGIRRMAISLDGCDAATHDQVRGVERTFDRSIAALEHARRIGLETQINSAIGHHNQAQLEALGELAGWLGVRLWSVFLLVSTGRAERGMLMDAVAHEQLYRRLAVIAEAPDCPFDVKTTAGQPFYRVRAQRMARQASTAQPRPTTTPTTAGDRPPRDSKLETRDSLTPFGLRSPLSVNDGKGICFIDHRGEVHPSGFLPIPCGNIRQRSLAEIYRQHEVFVDLRRPEGYAGKCGACEYRQLCGGSRSRAYALTGDHLASDPTCVYRPKGWHEPAATSARHD